MLRDVLVVDMLVDRLLSAIQRAVGDVAEVEPCAEFRRARARLLTKPPDFLVTNLRLEAYNGLHLVLLAAGTGTRCIVYAANDDIVLAREAQNLGAFYERLERLPFALRTYVTALLPQRDRRDVAVLDRRLIFRGGRRSTDLSALAASAPN
jgi:ActR/RegA family two-component response regulator